MYEFSRNQSIFLKFGVEFFLAIALFVYLGCEDKTGTNKDDDNNAGDDEVEIVTVGTQVWMAKNLNVTHYRNGDPIPNVTDGAQWYGLTSGAYCDYGNDPNNAATYGRLYNWYAVTDSRGLAPQGWHVPSDAKWQTLISNLGGRDAAGSNMKETGNSHWLTDNSDATNASGFTALPGGYRTTGIQASFMYMGYFAKFWTSATSPFPIMYYLNSAMTQCVQDYNNCGKMYGFSVRCIKD